MTPHPGTFPSVHALDGILHHPGRTYDLNGSRTPFAEMILMEGLFPVEDIVDRLPFRLRTLRNWARKGPFSTCFQRVHLGPCGNSVLLLNLNRLATLFDGFAELSRIEDAKGGLPVDPAMEGFRGLDEFARFVDSMSSRRIGQPPFQDRP